MLGMEVQAALFYSWLSQLQVKLKGAIPSDFTAPLAHTTLHDCIDFCCWPEGNYTPLPVLMPHGLCLCGSHSKASLGCEASISCVPLLLSMHVRSGQQFMLLLLCV